MIELIVDGEVRGKGRPRFVKATGRTYTDEPTMRAEARVQIAWIQAGRPRMEDGPLAIDLELVLRRPEAHWKRDGTLSAAGERLPWPTKKPDIDNAIKLVMDACNGCLYRDDVQVVCARVVRRWANPGEHEHTRIRVRPMLTLDHAATSRTAA